jgi:hypothetical protein
MTIEIIKGEDTPVTKFFSASTPETDARAKSIDQSNFEDSWKDEFEEFAWVPTDFARKLECERDEAREALSDWENAALHVEADHPDEKHCGCVPVLRKLLTDAREAFVIATDQMVIAQGRVREANEERDKARQQNSKLRYIAERAQTICQRWVSPQYADAGAVKQLRAELDQLKGGAK